MFLFLLEDLLALGLLLLHTKSVTLFFESKTLTSLVLFALEPLTSLILFFEEFLAAESLLFLKLVASLVVIFDALLTFFLFLAELLKPALFILLKAALPLKLVSLTLKPFLFKLRCSFLFSSLGCEKSTLVGLLLESDALSLFLLLALAFLTSQLLLAQTQLLLVTLSL